MHTVIFAIINLIFAISASLPGMKFTYYGHSCFSVETGGKKILFDPFVTPNELAAHINVDDIVADYILVSHGHSDHVEDCARIALRNDATVVAAYEVAVWLNNKDVKHYHPMNTGGKKTFEFGTVRCVNAVHSSSMPDGSYGGNPMGFVVQGERSFYYAGDTALTMDMQLIPKWATLDFAVLPIGDNFTMDYEDAIAAAELIQCKHIVGVHYDTFGFIQIDKEKVQQAFADAGLKLYLPGIGETIDL